MMTRIITVAALIASFAVGEARAAEFAYSATGGAACTIIRSNREFNSWRCPGPAGYSAVFHDLGNMVAVELGPTKREKAISEDGLMWRGVEKSLGDKVEWRLMNGKPYAAIVRIRRQDFDEKANIPRTVEELLVIKVSSQGACRVGAVDGKRPDTNNVAREMADTQVAPFRCGVDHPRDAAAPASRSN